MIRAMKLSDATAVKALTALAHPDWKPKPTGWYIGQHRTLVVVIDGAVVGYTTYGRTRQKHAFGRDLVVHPDHRRQKLGESLHGARLMDAEHRGATHFVGQTKDPAMEKILREWGGLPTLSDENGTYFVNKLEGAKTRILDSLANQGGFVIAAAAVAVVSAAVSAYASYEQGQTQQAIAKYNQKVAENNATAQRQAAQIAAENERDRNQKILAAQRAGIGASGVLGSEGSPLLLQTDSAEKAALNEARIRYSGEVGAKQQESEAVIQGYIGKRAAQQGYIGAGASVLQGVGSAASIYSRRTTTQGP